MQPPAPLCDRPTWRGRMHAYSFFAAIPAGVLLIIISESAAARTAASIYAATLLLVFGTSAAYHRLATSDRSRRVMQRLDHSMIYLLITGSYVPICIVALPRAWGIPILAAVGAMAIVGMVFKLTAWGRGRIAAFALYPIMGWSVVIAAPVLISNLSGLQLALLLSGGLAYTIGFPVLLVRRPNPWPKTFGYHEVWHTFTVVAAILHFAVVTTVVA